MEYKNPSALSSSYSLEQAALLLAGLDPAEVPSVQRAEDGNYIGWQEAAGYLSAILEAITDKELSTRSGKVVVFDALIEQIHSIDQADLTDHSNIETGKTKVRRDELRRWLVSCGMSAPSFLAESTAVTKDVDLCQPPYLDRNHSNYSPKLAASVSAWLALEHEKIEGKTVKQLLETWIEKNAANFDLIKSDGSKNRTGIEEAAKVANWQTVGGSPKTPG